MVRRRAYPGLALIAAVAACSGDAGSRAGAGGSGNAGGTGGARGDGAAAPGGSGPLVTPAEVSATGPLFEVRSGTRLKARWLVGEGGGRLLDGFVDRPRDAQLGRCHFAWTERTYCTPHAFLRGVPLFGPHYYADPGCTEPLLPAGPGLYSQLLHGRCPADLGVFEADKMASEYTAAYQSDGKQCWPAPADKLPRDLRRGLDVTATLAGGHMVRGAERAGWVPLFAEGDDGSRAFLTWARARDGALCGFGTDDLAEGKGRCLPYPTFSTLDGPQARFADAQCKTLVGTTGFPAPCDMSGFMRVDSTSSCAGDEHLYEVGSRLPQPFDRRSGTCAPSGPSSAAAFTLGPEVARETFPAGTLRLVAGAGRLRPMAVEGPLGLTPVSDAFWDRQLGVPCRVDESSPERCEPFARWAASSLYADPGCTAHVVAIDGCGPTYPFVQETVFAPPPAVGSGRRMFRLRGTQHRGPVFDSKDGKCMPVTPTVDRQWLVADVVDPETTYARVEVQIDP